MTAAAIASNVNVDDVLNVPGKIKDVWGSLTTGKGRHTLTLGIVKDSDEVLYYEDIRKGYKVFSKASHTFSYTCEEGERINAVIAYDCWSDDTGGDAEVKKGGVGKSEVEIEVKAQAMRGFHFKFYVYGKKK